MREQALAEDFIVHVNVSQRQLVQADFVDRVREVLERSGLPPGALVIEITESLLVDDDPATLLGELQALGVGLALDDFGTGYSSLSYLNKFPFTEIKIDRSFLVAAERSPRSAAILKAFIDITHSLQVPAIAEGVETEAQARLLRALRCTLGQGYLYGRPAPMAEFWRQWQERQGRQERS
jgi:EAL domain-containing protein (putative c-di-GMP-specific phosphodiesterase class I)